MAETDFLDFLTENDPLGLLAEKPKVRPKAKNSVLLNNFEEIVSFFEEHNREPQDSTKDIKEFQLFCRLKAIRSSADKVKKLKEYDLYGLLNKDGVLDIPLEDILDDDPCGLLGNDYDETIFTLKNVRKSDRISPDYIARRKFCKDFENYQPMFETLRQDLESGRRKLAVYNSQELAPNNFYVLGGVILFLKSVEGNVSNYQYMSGERRRYDGRTECIFDNGTTSDMLFRSLDKALQRDGYAISDYVEDLSLDNENVSDEDRPKGYVYVLRSRHAKLRNVPDIYKIGSTNTTVSDRIRNAVNEPTYLYAGVDIVETYRCFNIPARELEDQLHTFFDRVRLNINIPDEKGAVISPREWFCVSIEAVSEAVKLILLGTIKDYVYDPDARKIIAKRAFVAGKSFSAEGVTPFVNATTVNIEHFTNQGTFNDLSGASIFFPGKSISSDTPTQIE